MKARDHGEDQLRALVDECKAVLALVLKEGPSLFNRARKVPVRDSLPSSSEPGVIGAGGHGDRVGELVAAQVVAEGRHPFVAGDDGRCTECGLFEGNGVVDEEGVAVDRHGPPAGTADPVLRAWFKLWSHLNAAHAELLNVQRVIERNCSPQPRIAYRATSGGGAEVVAVGDEHGNPIAQPINLWCQNCIKYGYQWPAEHKKAGRCRPCRDYQYEHDMDAPEAIVRARYERREKADERRLA